MREPDAIRAVRSARLLARRLALTYAVIAVAWIVVSDWVEARLGLPSAAAQLVSTGKGILFVLVSATALYTLTHRFLASALLNHRRYRELQDQLRERERSIEQAYVDVLAAVTGGKLILLWPEDVSGHLGEVILPTQRLDRPEQLKEARALVGGHLGPLGERFDEALLAANEGLTNALKHGEGGEYEVRRTPMALQVVITDHGPGIDFHTLPRATLIAGYSTKASLGIGFTIMFEAAERILLATQPGLTTLVLEFPFPPVDRQQEPVSEEPLVETGVEGA